MNPYDYRNPSGFSKEQLLQEVSDWEHAEGNKGQVYTRSEVVAFMLKVIRISDLKHLCIPMWDSIDTDLKVKMIDASIANDVRIFDELAAELYGLN